MVGSRPSRNKEVVGWMVCWFPAGHKKEHLCPSHQQVGPRTAPVSHPASRNQAYISYCLLPTSNRHTHTCHALRSIVFFARLPMRVHRTCPGAQLELSYSSERDGASEGGQWGISREGQGGSCNRCNPLGLFRCRFPASSACMCGASNSSLVLSVYTVASLVSS